MATSFNQQRQDVPMGRTEDGKRVYPTIEYLRYQSGVYERIGGAVAPSITELDDSIAPDPSAAEIQRLLKTAAALLESVTQMDAQIGQLQAEVAELKKQTRALTNEAYYL